MTTGNMNPKEAQKLAHDIATGVYKDWLKWCKHATDNATKNAALAYCDAFDILRSGGNIESAKAYVDQRYK